MKKFILLLTVMVSVFSLGATDVTVTKKSPKGNVWKERLDIEEAMVKTPDTQLRSPFVKEGEEDQEPITLHIKFIYPDNLVPEYAAYEENGFGSSVWWEGEDEMNLEIDPYWVYEGDNIIVGSFTPVDKTTESNPDNGYFVFVELPALVDGAEVVIDANTIDRTYQFEFLTPEGKPFVPKHHVYDTQTKESVFDGEGDIEQGSGTIWIGSGQFAEKQGQSYYLINRSYTDGRAEKKWLTPPVISTNPLPEGIVVNACLIAYDHDGRDIFLITTPSTAAEGLIHNNIQEYVDGNIKLATTPSGNKEEMLQARLCLTCNGTPSYWLGTVFDNLVNEDLLVSSNLTTCIHLNDNLSEGMQYNIDINLVDNINGSGISAPVILPDPHLKEFRFIPLNITFGGNEKVDENLYCRSWDNWGRYDMYKDVNPFIPFLTSDYDGIIGNNCPSLVSLGTWPDMFGQFPIEYRDFLIDFGYLNAAYCGRNGEAMTMDAWLSEITPEQDGDTQIYNISMDNVLVDNSIPGCNNAVLGCNLNKVDWVPPTMQRLYFTNKEGVVTDRFGSSDEAAMTIYAGDFRYELNDTFDKDMMGVAPLSEITVEYAPFGTDDFSILQVTENPEKFFMPGFGYCYEGSLAAVDKKSSNGWFDMRITLKDDSGNWQTQTISPAFYVGDLCGVKSVEAPETSFYVSDGKILNTTNCDFRVYSIDGRLVPNGNLTPGIYVVMANGKSQKIYVK